MYREIKRKLYSGRKDDPATRVEVRVDQDVYGEGIALAGKFIELVPTRLGTISSELNGTKEF